MASTRQHFVWGWGRLPRSGVDSVRSSSSSVTAPQSSRGSNAAASPAAVVGPSGSSASITRLPRLLEALETSTSLRSISAAQQHVVAVTNSGEAYTWGPWGPAVVDDDDDDEDSDERAKDERGAAKGREPSPDAALRFRLIHGCDGVYQVATLSTTMYAITAASDCYGWRWGEAGPGWSDHSLLPARSVLPVPLPALTAMQCTTIACGPTFALFLTSSGLLFTLGQPSHSPALTTPSPSSSPAPAQPTLVSLHPSS